MGLDGSRGGFDKAQEGGEVQAPSSSDSIPSACLDSAQERGEIHLPASDPSKLVTAKQSEVVQVPVPKKIAYGAVSFATLALTIQIRTYGTDFYLQLGALLPIIAIFTVVARSFDIVTDLWMGWFSDNARTPFGRRRPFMAVGCIPYGIIFFLFFAPPTTLGPVGISIYFGVTYVFFYLGDTLATVPYEALGPELSTNYKERNTIFFVTRLFQTGGSVAASVAPAVMQNLFVSWGWTPLQAVRIGLMLTAAFFGLWFIVTTFICVAVIQERPIAETGEGSQVPLVPSVLRSFRNPAIVSLVLTWVMDGLQLAVLVTLFPFFIRYYIKPNGPAAEAIGPVFLPATFIGINIALIFASAALSTPLWLVAAQRFGKFQVWIAASVLVILTNLLYLIPSEGQNVLVMLCLGMCLARFRCLERVPKEPGGLSLTADGLYPPSPDHSPLQWAFQADVIDYEELLHGIRSEGTFSVYGTLVNKTVAIPAAAIPLGILSLLGFVYPIDSVDQPQPTGVVSFLYLGITLFPAGCSVIGLIAKYQFPIRDARTVGLIQDGTMALANGSAALDPVTGRSIRRPKLNPKEEQAYWLLENFGQKAWRRITTDSGKARGLAFLSLIWAAGSTSVAAALGGAALYTVLSFMEDPQNSINATMAIIAAMFSLCWSFVCISSFMDARKLQRLEPRFLYDLILQLQKCRDVNGTIIPSSAAR